MQRSRVRHDEFFLYAFAHLLKSCSFDVLEISSGFLSIPTDDWAELVKLTKSIGLKAKPEVGILFGAGGDTEGLESKGTRDPRWVIEVRPASGHIGRCMCSQRP